MIRVLIVDDHALVRSGIQKLLAEAKGIKVVGDAESGEEALRFIRETTVDVVLLDIKMPGIGGLETIRRMLRLRPHLRIITVTAFREEPFPSRSLQAGAAGYLTKESTVDEMVDAINKVFSGQRYISAEIAHKLALKTINDEQIDASPLEALSERELQVMMMITNGYKVQEISDKLCLSPKTINSYRYRIFDKLHIKNDVELTHLALRHGVLDKTQFEDDV